MNKDVLISNLEQYFKLQELVDEPTFLKYGKRCWSFLDAKLLYALWVIREDIGKPITINNWMWGGNFSQRGLRHNQSPMVKSKKGIYLSAHCLGKALDFDVKGMKAEEVRDWIVKNNHYFDFKIRLENKLNGKQINWVHLDTVDDPNNKKIHLFNV